MCKKNNSSLFFVCSLIEQIGRTLHQKRGKVVSCLGTDRIRILLKNADILHCEPIAKVADDVVAEFGLQQDDYDNVGQSKYLVPDVWTIGKVYARLIEDISSDGKRCGFSKRYFLVLVACRHLTCTKTECRKMFLSLIAPLTTIRLNRGKRSNRLPYIFAQGQER